MTKLLELDLKGAYRKLFQDPQKSKRYQKFLFRDLPMSCTPLQLIDYGEQFLIKGPLSKDSDHLD